MSGRFHVYGVQIVHGSYSMYIKHNDSSRWLSEVQPPWVNDNFINWLGLKVNGQNE